ncbi:MAG: DegV family EDD domain-containing protein [Mycoplasmataceae bacterium]|jgi:DegV family protein with EDD domain|nr:DegV family EDD domain-containing protein [Mycoplasmataceae bacterium]
MKTRIGILIDSSTTYDDAFISQNKIEVIPLSFSDATNKTFKDDNKSITREDLLKRLDNHESFKTSATPIGELMTKVNDMLQNCETVIFLPISSGLSSQYSQSLIIQKEFEGQFFPIRSLSGAAGNEFVLKLIVEAVKSGKDVKTIVSEAEQHFNKISTYFSCEDSSGMTSGGRVSKAIVKAINLFKLKPIIQLDGKNHYGGIGKNYNNIIKKIIKSINNDFQNKLLAENILNISIYYAGYEDKKKETIINLLAEGFKFPKDKIAVRWLPNVVLIHAHRGAYGVSLESSIEHKIRDYED